MLHVVVPESGGPSGSVPSFRPFALLAPPWTYARLIHQVTDAMERDATHAPSSHHSHPSPRLYYRDGDGDLITVSSDRELLEMVVQQERRAATSAVSGEVGDDTMTADQLDPDDEECVLLEHRQEKRQSPFTLILAYERASPSSMSNSHSPSTSAEFHYTSGGAFPAPLVVSEEPSSDESDSTEESHGATVGISSSAAGLSSHERSMIDAHPFIVLGATTDERTNAEEGTVPTVTDESTQGATSTRGDTESLGHQVALLMALLSSVAMAWLAYLRGGLRAVARAGSIEYRRNPVWVAMQICCVLALLTAVALASVARSPHPPPNAAPLQSVDLTRALHEMTHTLAEAEQSHTRHSLRQQQAIDDLVHEIADLKAQTAHREEEERRWKEQQTVRAWMIHFKEQAANQFELQTARIQSLAQDVTAGVESLGASIARGSTSLEDSLHEKLATAAAGVQHLTESLHLPSPSVSMIDLGSVQRWTAASEAIEDHLHAASDLATNLFARAVDHTEKSVVPLARDWAGRARDAAGAAAETIADLWNYQLVRLQESTPPRSERHHPRRHEREGRW